MASQPKLKPVNDVPANVYGKIAAIQAELAKTGIAKSRRNQQQGYSFRGIDEVYAALAPLLAEHGLCVMPRILARELIERQNKSGNPLFYVTVEAEFDFVSADDGSAHTVRTFGEAMDSGDKATNKAMSAAYKYAALMTFAIPTEGDNDADATTHEVAARGTQQRGEVSPPQPISDADWALIVQLVEATNTNTKALCEAYKVDSLKALTVPQFNDAKAILEKRLAGQAKPPSLAAELGDKIEF